MAGRFLRMTRKWLEGAAGLRQETVTKSFTKSVGISREPQALLACESLIQSKRADELISGSLKFEGV